MRSATTATGSRRSARAARHAAIALAALCLAGQLSSLAHLVLVPHATCSEHGELLHPADGPSAGSTGQAAAPSQPAQPAVTDALAAAGSHGHDHCLFATLHRDGSWKPPSGSAVLTAPGWRDVCGEQRVVVSTAQALFRLAPKHSPPA